MAHDIDYPQYQHPALTSFSSLAAAYCALFDRPFSGSGQTLLRQILTLLPQIYSAALALPSPHVLFDPNAASVPEDEEDDPTGPGDPERDPDREFLELEVAAHQALASYLGAIDGYREVYDPYGPDSE